MRSATVLRYVLASLFLLPFLLQPAARHAPKPHEELLGAILRVRYLLHRHHPGGRVREDGGMALAVAGMLAVQVGGEKTDGGR